MIGRAVHLADRNLTLSPLNQPPAIGNLKNGFWFLEWERCEQKSRFSRLIIFGGGHGHREAPLDDPSWMVWALNTVPPIDSEGRLRCDLWWDIHQRKAQSDDDLRWIKACPVPIVVPSDLMDAGEHTITLPLERLLHVFPDAPFACTFAYQIAFALVVGFETIGLYGVELAYGSPRERTVEWACVNWWIGYAEAKGIEIRRPKNSRLGRHPKLYGVDYDAEIESTKSYLDLMSRFGEEVAAGG